MSSKKPFNILIVDDDDGVLTSARLLLKQYYEWVKTLNTAEQIPDLLKHMDIDVVLLDMNFSIGEQEGEEGLKWIQRIRKVQPACEIIAITAYGDLQVAIEAMKLGVRDFITKPWENERLLLTIENVLSYQVVKHQLSTAREVNKLLHAELADYQQPIGNDPGFVDMLRLCEKVAPTDAEVLITGENGTGKEVIAMHIHRLSRRSEHPFIKVDLGSLAPSLFESELFGHKKGAFTDAKKDRIGKLEHANGGTLFLDEIGNLPIALQSKLLTVLQQKEVTPLGSNKSVALDVRIICATNMDIAESIDTGTFRQDLLYRINTIEVNIPSLKDRKEDIQLIATHYLERFKDKYRKKQLKIGNDGFETMEAYGWPGNIRELSHVIERAVIMADGDQIGRLELGIQSDPIESISNSLDIKENEKALILKALGKNKGNITHAARDLGIDRLALYRRLDKYGL